MWGVDQAINAGLALSSYARLALHGMLEQGVSPGTILEVHRLLEETVIHLCQGQYLALDFRSRVPTLAEYFDMVRLKTGVLLGTACEVGALVAGAPEKRVAARQFAETLGIGFQLRDDYLGMWGNPQEMGKPANDFKDREWSLPLAVRAEPLDTGETPPESLNRIIQQWTRQAEKYLLNLGLPTPGYGAFVELTRILAERPA